MHGFELDTWLIFVLVLLASARTFRLLAFDEVAEPFRTGYAKTVGILPDRLAVKMWEALECPWCAGYWWAAGWTITALAWHDAILWQMVAFSFAANYVAATLNGLYDIVHETAEEKLNDE